MILACLFISMYSSVVLLLHVCVCFGPHGRVSWTQCHLSTWSHRPPPPPPPSYYYRCTSCAADTTIHNSYLYCLWLSDSFSAHLIDVTHIVEVPTRNPEGRVQLHNRINFRKSANPKIYIRDFGNFKRGFLSMKFVKRKVISGYVFFINCIDINWY